MRFRLFIGGLVALLVLYVIFWFVLAHVARVKIGEWIEAQRTEGIDVTYDRLDIGGFPYRLQVELRDLKVTGHEGDLLWEMESPNAAAVIMPWNRNHVILIAEEGGLSVSAEGAEPDRLKVGGSKASIVVNRDREPLRISAVARQISIEGPAAGPEGLALRDGELHWRAGSQVPHRPANEAEDDDPREPLAWQLAVRGADINHEMLGLSPYGRELQKFAAVLEVRGSGIDTGASPETIQAWRDQGGTIEVTSFELVWGELDVLMNGSLTLDQQFRPLGAFTAQVKGYEPIISYLHEAGHITAAEAETATRTLEAIVAADTDKDNRLSVPITLQSGRLFVGPLPVANLPALLPQEEEAEPEPKAEPKRKGEEEPSPRPELEPEPAPAPEAAPDAEEQPEPDPAPAPEAPAAPEGAAPRPETRPVGFEIQDLEPFPGS